MLLEEFLLNANKETYASGKKAIKKGKKHAFQHSEHDYDYLDIYTTMPNFFHGKTTVTLKNKKVFEMEYAGRNINGNEEKNYEFLRKALQHMPIHAPFRGPQKYVENNYEYLNNWRIKDKQFDGEEEILFDNELFYELHYRGKFV